MFGEGFGVVFVDDESAHGVDLAGEGSAGALDAAGAELDVGAEVDVHLHLAGRGDGVLVGGEEEELPAFLFPVKGNQVADVLCGVLGGGVFLAVGEDGEDDLGGLLCGREGLEAAVGLFDGPANGIKQRGAASRLVGGGGELRDLGERLGMASIA